MNIDKDIELVSNMKNIELKGKVNEQYIYAKIPEEYLNAIENVLADRERLIEENKVLKEDYQTENQYYEETIKDKIEELEGQNKTFSIDILEEKEMYINNCYAIDVLEELLGE